ncbi:hypothetical protein Tco_1022983 [Tanacetum coccineum]
MTKIGVSQGKCAGKKGKKPKLVDNEECKSSKQGSKKGRLKFRRRMRHQYNMRWTKDKTLETLPLWILKAQLEAVKQENVKGENLGRPLKPIFEIHSDGIRYFENRVWLPLFGGLRDLIMHESHKLKYSIHPGSDIKSPLS